MLARQHLVRWLTTPYYHAVFRIWKFHSTLQWLWDYLRIAVIKAAAAVAPTPTTTPTIFQRNLFSRSVILRSTQSLVTFSALLVDFFLTPPVRTPSHAAAGGGFQRGSGLDPPVDNRHARRILKGKPLRKTCGIRHCYDNSTRGADDQAAIR